MTPSSPAPRGRLTGSMRELARPRVAVHSVPAAREIPIVVMKRA
jgi:hypothetical protein